MIIRTLTLACCLLLFFACGGSDQAKDSSNDIQKQKIDSIATEVEKAGEELQKKMKETTTEIDSLLEGI